MEVDYSIFYKTNYETIESFCADNDWDIFISSYNKSERVNDVFEKDIAKKKLWLILPEYGFSKKDYPTNGVIYSYPEAKLEYDFLTKFFTDSKINNNQNICIDITGFTRPHLIFIIRLFFQNQITNFDLIYTDPLQYKDKEKTDFSIKPVSEIRPVAGCEGSPSINFDNDILIISSGFDHELIKSVSENKRKAKKVQIFGFPSLQLDMYQQNILRAQKASESIGGVASMSQESNYFAPANDPFVTASVIQEIIRKENSKKQLTNIYLCPLATKAQAVGFILYYIWEEGKGLPISIIFPFTPSYNQETTKGISKIWKYSIELPQLL